MASWLGMMCIPGNRYLDDGEGGVEIGREMEGGGCGGKEVEREEEEVEGGGRGGSEKR